jgi:hypothetical protein
VTSGLTIHLLYFWLNLLGRKNLRKLCALLAPSFCIIHFIPRLLLLLLRGSGFGTFLSPLKRVSICKQVSQLKLNPISLAAREDFVTFKHLFWINTTLPFVTRWIVALNLILSENPSARYLSFLRRYILQASARGEQIAVAQSEREQSASTLLRIQDKLHCL